MSHDLDYIRSTYQAPARTGDRVTVDGKLGLITGALSGRLMVRFERAGRAIPCHPAWRVEYLDAPGGPVMLGFDDGPGPLFTASEGGEP
jgi:hypothetical protein